MKRVASDTDQTSQLRPHLWCGLCSRVAGVVDFGSNSLSKITARCACVLPVLQHHVQVPCVQQVGGYSTLADDVFRDETIGNEELDDIINGFQRGVQAKVLIENVTNESDSNSPT